jgi:hypothetical protein
MTGQGLCRRRFSDRHIISKPLGASHACWWITVGVSTAFGRELKKIKMPGFIPFDFAGYVLVVWQFDFHQRSPVVSHSRMARFKPHSDAELVIPRDEHDYLRERQYV